MQNLLKLQFTTDDDGIGELFAEAHAGDYSGLSSAWFSVEQLLDFSQTLIDTYPLKSNPALSLEGGYYHESGESLVQVHLGIKFYPIGSIGKIGCHVSLSTPVDKDDRKESSSSLSIELQTTYEELGRFARSLKALVQGNISEAILETSN